MSRTKITFYKTRNESQEGFVTAFRLKLAGWVFFFILWCGLKENFDLEGGSSGNFWIIGGGRQIK